MWVSPPQVCQGPGVLFRKSPEFVLARLWVTSTSNQPSLQRLAAGRDGQRCLLPAVQWAAQGGQQGKPGSSAGRELRHFSQAFLAELPTGPHWSPNQDLWGGQRAPSAELSRVDHGQGGFRGAKTTCLQTLEPWGAQGKEITQRELGTPSLHSPQSLLKPQAANAPG